MTDRALAGRFSALGAILAILAGCAGAPPVVCPPLRAYDAAFNARLADEIEAAPAGAAWPLAIEHYVEMRDQLRAACP